MPRNPTPNDGQGFKHLTTEDLARERKLFWNSLWWDHGTTGPRALLSDFIEGFGPGADVEFFVNVADMGPDGFAADAEGGGDFLVEHAAGEMIENLLFPDGQSGGGIGFGGRFLEGLNDAAGNLARDGRAAFAQFLDQFQKPVGRGFLEQPMKKARPSRISRLSSTMATLIGGIRIWGKLAGHIFRPNGGNGQSHESSKSGETLEIGAAAAEKGEWPSHLLFVDHPIVAKK
jgi:hypothetical protein